MTTILIADDHPLFLRSLASLIANDSDDSVIAVACDGSSALAAIRKNHPDIAILDIKMPGASGLEILSTIKQERIPTRVILLTAGASDAELYESVAAGVAGFLLKDATAEQLLDCVHSVALGRRWLPPDLVEPAVTREAGRRHKWARLSSELTARETEIVQLVATTDASNKEIAFRIDVSEGTVKVHLNNIFRKLQVSSRAELLDLFAG